MKVPVAYGQGYLQVELPDDRTTVIKPAHVPGLDRERDSVLKALQEPIGTRPLRDWIKPGDRILLCSDGLSGVVSSDTIGATLLANDDPQGQDSVEILPTDVAFSTEDCGTWSRVG